MKTITNAPRVAFLFTTKDRPDLTLRSLRSIELCRGFDLIWIDGSTSPAGKEFPHSVQLKNCRIVEIHQGVRPRHTDKRFRRLATTLGSDTAIHFGMSRALELGYDYCGIIENDIEFQPGWFPKLMELFDLGRRDGFEVGAVTARSMTTRVMAYQPQYLVMWNVGAAMVLFTRKAAQIVMATYAIDRSVALAHFYKKNFGVDYGDVWELWYDKPSRDLAPDWAFAKYLYKYGMVSLGTLPSLASNIDMDIRSECRSSYVTATPEITSHDKVTCTRLKEYLRGKDRTPDGQKLAFVIDKMGGAFFRAQLYHRWLRTLVFCAKRFAHPVDSTRTLYRKLRERSGSSAKRDYPEPPNLAGSGVPGKHCGSSPRPPPVEKSVQKPCT